MQLRNKVRQTYIDRFNEMDIEYCLHFASRLYAWSEDNDAKQLLDNLRPEVLPANHKERRQHILAIREELRIKNYDRDVNDYARRKLYFEKYPNLLLVHNALFRIRHWLCIYDVDERELLYELVPRHEVSRLITALLQDQTAQKILSTYFINTVYLYEKMYESPDVPSIKPRAIIGLADLYDLSNAADIQILIYLYTHCILGETLFYYQPVKYEVEVYTEMLKRLEQLIDQSFNTINLDNKFEFLVCARICNYSSYLAEKIYAEAEKSVNSEGFIVDMHNTNANPYKQSFMMSEHRNVLFILSMTNPVFNNQTKSLLRFS